MVRAQPSSVGRSADDRGRPRPLLRYDGIARGAANFVLNPAVEIRPDKQVVITELLRRRMHRIRIDHEHGKPARPGGALRQQTLFFVQRRRRPFQYVKVGHFSEAAFCISAAPGAAPAPPIGFDRRDRLNESLRRAAMASRLR